MSRYVLSVVYRDGVPREIGTYDDRTVALCLRDCNRESYDRHSQHWMVHDEENPERGSLDWDDE